jgi:hypothetical protein
MNATIAAEQRRLTHAVATATDTALAGIVAYFDGMADRRAADWLLDAARPRLRKLQPPRPIRFARLLFLPLDGAIVDARKWRRQDGGIPRQAVAALANALHRALGAEALMIEAATAAHSFADLPVVDAVGRRLWFRAARLAPALPCPADWEEAGLTPADFHIICATAAGVWRHADPLWSALIAARDGPPEAMVRDALTNAAGEDARVLEAMLATILLKASRPGSVATAAATTRVGPPGLADQMLDRWIESCSPDLAVDDPAGAARLAEAFVEAIEDLESCPAARRAERRQRVGALRRDIGEACRHAFTEGTARALIDPLAKAGTRTDDATMARLEATARSLKRLETAGRTLGGSAAYDAAQRHILDHFAARRGHPGASPADLARLAEIIAGPEAALKLLDG